MSTTAASRAPMVSVIVPNYNHGKFLRQRIDTVLAQTYTDFELILLDDASTDDSPEILRSYQNDPRVSHLVINPQNGGGPFLQWKKGMELARGKYVWIAESDDWSEPRFLETLVNGLEAHPEAALAFSRSRKVDEHNVLKELYNFEAKDFISSTEDFYANGTKFCERILCKYNILVNASSVVFRREAYGKTNGVETRHRICSDWLLWWDLSRVGNVLFFSEPLNLYRRHSFNTSLQWQKELPIVFRYCDGHWPQGASRNVFVQHVKETSLTLYRNGQKKQGWKLSLSLGGFFALNVFSTWFWQRVVR